MSIHNIYFYGELRKKEKNRIITKYSSDIYIFSVNP